MLVISIVLSTSIRIDPNLLGKGTELRKVVRRPV